MSRFEKIKSTFFLGKMAVVVAASIAFLLAAGESMPARAQIQPQGFENVAQLQSLGWVMKNNSAPVGTTGWFQGNQTAFPAQAGAANSYIAADFNNAGGVGTISNWLITPHETITNGTTFRFWTRTKAGSARPDRLEVRLSTNGASTDVGNTPQSVGDFTTLLLTINPNLTIGGYTETWTEYSVNLSQVDLGCFGIGGGRLAFRYVVSNAGPQGDNSNYIGIDSFSATVFIPVNSQALLFRRTPLDYNCDGKTDFAVVRNTGGGQNGQLTWFINDGTTHTQMAWGLASDIPVSGDFDGDLKADISVYRPDSPPNSFFYTLLSSNGTLQSRELGAIGDDPTVVGDYDGDGKTDYAVYRGGTLSQPSFWYYRASSGIGGAGGITFVQYGRFGDDPAPGDYDGDGKNDFCVQRSSESGRGLFLLSKSSGGMEAVVWGLPGDTIVPGDYDGDGRTDFAVAAVRAGSASLLWSVLGRNDNNIIHYGVPWGLAANAFPAQGDYDGDAKTDIAVWVSSDDSNQNFFYVRRSSDGALQAVEWGQNGDYPAAFFNTH